MRDKIELVRESENPLRFSLVINGHTHLTGLTPDEATQREAQAIKQRNAQERKRDLVRFK